MITRRTLVLSGVLLGFAAVAFIVQWLGSDDRPRDRAPLVPGLKTGEVAEVRITAAGGEAVLSRVGNGWKFGAAKAPADAAAVEALLAKLAAARVEAVVSVNPAKQDAYEADAKQGISVRLAGAGGNVVAAIVVGKRGPDFASCYLRRDGAVEVLLVSPDVRVDVARTAESWRESPKKP